MAIILTLWTHKSQLNNHIYDVCFAAITTWSFEWPFSGISTLICNTVCMRINVCYRMEMFVDSCAQMLQEFKVLLKDHAISPTRLLQLMAINMFAIENTALKGNLSENVTET